jgi:hypothetical protein
VLGLAWAFALAAQAQAPSGTDAARDGLAAQLWRAQNRLGYGPSEAMLGATDAGTDARTWARQHIDDAHQASRTAPAIQPDLA